MTEPPPGPVKDTSVGRTHSKRNVSGDAYAKWLDAGDADSQYVVAVRGLIEAGPSTSNELARVTGLSERQLSRCTSDLKHMGLAVETGERRARSGEAFKSEVLRATKLAEAWLAGEAEVPKVTEIKRVCAEHHRLRNAVTALGIELCERTDILAHGRLLDAVQRLRAFEAKNAVVLRAARRDDGDEPVRDDEEGNS